ncbi:MAG TPA: hypothetical protein VGM94_00425 [Galbitalea sp.]
MAASLERLTAMADKQAAQRHSIVVQLIRALLGLWSGFSRVDDPHAVIGMAARSATLSLAATDRTRLLQRSYLTASFRELGVSTLNLPTSLASYPRTNADPLEVWQRPVGQWIWQRRNGGTLEDQRGALTDYLTSLAESDAMIAERDEASRIYESRDQITGFRRVIHPELSASGTCGLCIVASQRLYHRGDLMPIHGDDHCTTMGITEDFDPGLKLNADDLKTIYAAAGGNAAEQLANTRITINEHGELGPVLVKHGDHFRTAKEAGRPEYVKPTPESVAASSARNLVSANDALSAAEAHYDEFLRDHPGSESVSAPAAIVIERIALFRSLQFLREYQTAAAARAKKLAI